MRMCTALTCRRHLDASAKTAPQEQHWLAGSGGSRAPSSRTSSSSSRRAAPAAAEAAAATAGALTRARLEGGGIVSDDEELVFGKAEAAAEALTCTSAADNAVRGRLPSVRSELAGILVKGRFAIFFFFFAGG
jgi:hypothetical protein